MPYGTVNADVIQSSVSGVSLGAGNASIMKNRIINGAMVISQYNGTSSVTPTASAYVIDRWKAILTQSSKLSFQQNAGSVTPPVGFSNYLGATSLSAYSVAAGDVFTLSQFVEGFNSSDLAWGTANAKTITLSFQVYSSLTGTFGGALSNSGNTRSYPFTYTISSANTWTTVSVTIAGDTSGTWVGATNGIGIQVIFSLGAGSTGSGTAGSWATANYSSATGATSVVGTNGATFYITGVQLEVGSSATGFEYRQYQQELALCQRYYVRYSNSASGLIGLIGQIQTATTANYGIPLSMRSAPSVGYSSLNINDASANPSITSIATTSTTTGISTFIITASGGGLTIGRAANIYVTTAGYLDLSAEL